MGKQPSQSDDGVSVSEYCTEKLRSLVEGELQTIVEVGEESMLLLLGGLSSSGQPADVLGVSNDVNTSTVLKQRELTRREFLPLEILPVKSPVKRVANIAFNVRELSDHLVGTFWSTKIMRSRFGRSDRTGTSVGSISTVIRLSEKDELVAEHAFVE